MTFLLIIYLFLSDGSVISAKYEGIPTMNECLLKGRDRAHKLWEGYNRDGDFSFMCIRKEVK